MRIEWLLIVQAPHFTAGAEVARDTSGGWHWGRVAPILTWLYKFDVKDAGRKLETLKPKGWTWEWVDVNN